MSRILKTAAVLTILSTALATPALAAQTGAKDTDGDGIPDSAEALLGTDPLVADTDGDGQNDLVDKNPTFMANPIDVSGTPATFKIKEALVENNYDYQAKAGASDHLELLVSNQGKTALTGFSIYYSIKDLGTGKVEGTFRKLDGFSVPAGGEARIHFDQGTAPGHFRANPNSIYVTSQNAKIFDVTLKAPGEAAVAVEIKKDKGGAEAKD